MTNDDKFKAPFGNWAKSVQQRLNYEYAASRSILTHSSTIGAIREEVIRDILSKFLPLSVEIGTGQLVDSVGNLSDQVDIVIAKNSTPVFRFGGGVSAFLYDTVLATIEVKSMLYRDKLKEALENSFSVKNLIHVVDIRSKGPRLFNQAFDWVTNIGGLNELEQRLLHPSLTNTLDLPDDIAYVLAYVRYWLHWTEGDYQNPEIFQKFPDIFNEPEFDFFTNLLCYTFNENNSFAVLTSFQSRSDEIRIRFFEKLYEYLLYEEMPPATFVLAYGGYQNIKSMVDEVRSWYLKNKAKVGWFEMPKVIMNHKMVMYRRFNEYHCHEFEYPVLIFMQALSSIIARDLSFQTSLSTTSLNPYFDLTKIFGDEHPKFSPSYLVWSLPMDNTFPDSILMQDQLQQNKSAHDSNTQMPINTKATKLKSNSKRK